MKDEQSLVGFNIVCKDCQKAGKPHHTHLYIDWDKKYYMIMCFDCGKSSAYDENGKEIELIKQEKRLLN